MTAAPFLVRWRDALRDSGLGHYAKLVGYTLATHMDAEGGSCCPGVPLIAREASISERSARTALRELEAAGYIVTVQGGGRRVGGGYSSNAYQATFLARHALPGSDEEARQEVQLARQLASVSPAPGTAKGAQRGRAYKGDSEARHVVPGSTGRERTDPDFTEDPQATANGSLLPCGFCGALGTCDCEVEF